jgi:hypothetical protein
MHVTQDSISMLIYEAQDQDSSDPGPDAESAMILHIPIDQVRCLIQASAEDGESLLFYRTCGESV